MKKFILMFVALFTIGFGGLSVVSGQIVGATTHKVVKQYHYDHNTLTGHDMNYTHYQYENIPASSKYYTHKSVKIGSGWNYKRYQRTNYYTGGY